MGPLFPFHRPFPLLSTVNPVYGALAQGYERYLHTVEVTGSNPVRPITSLIVFSRYLPSLSAFVLQANTHLSILLFFDKER